MQARLRSDEHTEKEDESPVTVADYGAQALVTWSLLRSLPGQTLSMVAEEDAADLRCEPRPHSGGGGRGGGGRGRATPARQRWRAAPWRVPRARRSPERTHPEMPAPPRRAPGGADMLARITQLVNATLAAHPPPGSGAPPAALSEADVLALVDRGCSEGGAAGRHWVLDPIDGTRGFVGGRQYAVCLGLLSEGAAVLGVLGCPNLPRERIAPGDCAEGQAGRAAAGDDVGVIFAAARGAGAYAGPIYGGRPAERVRAAAEGGAPPRVMESFDSRHSDHDLGSVLAREVGAAQPSLRLDSQAKYGERRPGSALPAPACRAAQLTAPARPACSPGGRQVGWLAAPDWQLSAGAARRRGATTRLPACRAAAAAPSSPIRTWACPRPPPHPHPPRTQACCRAATRPSSCASLLPHTRRKSGITALAQSLQRRREQRSRMRRVSERTFCIGLPRSRGGACRMSFGAQCAPCRSGLPRRPHVEGIPSSLATHIPWPHLLAGFPLDYSRGRYFETLRGGGIVAAPPALHAALIDAVRKHKQ